MRATGASGIRVSRGRPVSGTSAVLVLLALLLPVAFLGSVPGTASASVGAAFPVTDSSGKHQSPDIGGRVVVWKDDRDGLSNIRAKDLDTNQEFVVASGGSVKRAPVTNGGFIFWEDNRNGDSDIYGYEISSATEFVLAGGAGEQRGPEIEGDTVVWQSESAAGLWRVFSASLGSYRPAPGTSPAGKLEATGGDTMMNPVVSDRFIVWEETRDGSPGIYAKDRETGEQTRVASGFSVGSPAVGGSVVVWRASDGGTFDVFGRDLRSGDPGSGETFPVAGGAGDQVAPAISSKLVVWQDGPNDKAGIRGRDLETGESFQIAGGDDRGNSIPAISGETVVWQEERLSQTTQPDGTVTTNQHLDILGADLDVSPAAPKGLEATGSLDGVALKWSANTETDLAGYNVYRSDSEAGPYTRLNDGLLTSASFNDDQAPKGAKSYYQVSAVDGTGKESVRSGASSTAQVLSELGLSAGAGTINSGESVELSGRLSSGGDALSGRTVELFERPAGASQWTRAAKQPDLTGADGGFSVSGVKPDRTTEYRARFAGEAESGLRASTSPVQRVRVKLPATLGLSPSRGTLVAGQALALSGRLSSGETALPGERVLLQHKPAGARSFSRVPGQPTAGVLTGSEGGYRLGGIQPRKNTVYRAIFVGGPELQPAASAPKRVNVKAKVTANVVSSGGNVSIAGQVTTARNGSVDVKIRRNGRVVASRTVSLADSRYRVTYRPQRLGRYTVTASFARDFDNLGNVSPARNFTAGR